MGEFGARHRPFDVPATLSELDGPTETGVVILPSHLDWSSGRRYDLGDAHDRRRVYEMVLREGTVADQRRYVDSAELVRVFDELFLPEPIRDAWRRLLGQRVA